MGQPTLGYGETAMDKPGLIVAPLTPFDSDLKIDEARLRRQIDYVVANCRASMVVAAGVETQEYAYLTLDERKGLIQRTLEFVGGRVPVMVGISHPALRIAIELADEAERFVQPRSSCWRRYVPLPARLLGKTLSPISR